MTTLTAILDFERKHPTWQYPLLVKRLQRLRAKRQQQRQRAIAPYLH